MAKSREQAVRDTLSSIEDLWAEFWYQSEGLRGKGVTLSMCSTKGCTHGARSGRKCSLCINIELQHELEALLRLQEEGL